MPSVPASSIHTSTLPAMNECWQEALHLAQREAHARGSYLVLNTLPEGCFYYLEKGRLTILHGAADGSVQNMLYMEPGRSDQCGRCPGTPGYRFPRRRLPVLLLHRCGVVAF